MYGIELIAYIDKRFKVILDVPHITDDWNYICWIVNRINEIKLPSEELHEFLEYVQDYAF